MFIKDPARQFCLNAINSHIARKASVLITANHGCGKTQLLRQIQNTAATVRVRSLGSLHQVLGRIAEIKETLPMHKDKYLDYRCEHPTTIIIDEAQDLDRGIWPYFKIMADHGNSLILAGRSGIYDTLQNRHPDMLSRLTHIKLEPLSEDDMFDLVKNDFDADAFSIIYGSTYDMRTMRRHIDNCRDYINANGLTKVDIDVVTKFVE
jgi:hypothetical protein